MKIETTSLQNWQIASKTRPIKAKPLISLMVDRKVASKFLVDTLEGHEPLGDGSIICVGEAGDVWQQTQKKLLQKYVVTAIDADGWMDCQPLPDNAVDVDEFRKLVGDDAIVNLKIEDKKGLDYVKNTFVKTPNTVLVLARGDMYVELDRPHEILTATKTLLEKDPEAICGSRLLLSTIHDPVPSCADWNELAWLADIGYKNMMLCDELCLKEELLSRAVNAFQAFRNSYTITRPKPLRVLPTVARPVRVDAPPPSPVKEDKSIFGKGWAWLNGRQRSL